MINQLIIDIAFATAVITSILNFIVFFKNDSPVEILKNLARTSYFILTSLIIVASATLLVNILGHNFQITYVWSYSSNELPLHLLISSFFAGQEGSLLLWILFFLIFGLFLLKYTSDRGYEHVFMAVFNLIVASLLLMLIAKSPFEMIWETFQQDSVKEGFMPQNGRGLNPILENFWMIIHPPILFVGYTAMAIPYIFAVSAMLKRDYDKWIDAALPWTLFANSILGLGLILGGVWAYETLGWGGFWGWDPVENSSLIPWIAGVALSHTMLVQKRTGALKKTNLLLAVMTFSLVLYAVFLTRSGVLSDASVHSFGEAGGIYYDILLRLVLFYFVFGLVLIIIRAGEIKTDKNVFSHLNKETMLASGTAVMSASALIIFIGTSYPVFAKLFNIPPATADIAFYDKWNLPLAVLIALLSGLALYFKWKQEILKRRFSSPKFYLPVIISFVLAVLLYFLGLDRFDLLALAFAGIYALTANLVHLKSALENKFSHSGAYISHAGFACLMFGVIGSGAYSESKIVNLREGDTKSALGYELTYKEKVRIQKELKDREKYAYKIDVQKNGLNTTLSPVFYLSDYNRRESYFLEPDIKILLDRDIYLSPVNVQIEMQTDKLILGKDQRASVPFDTALKIEFLKFDMSKAMQSMNQSEVQLGAVVKFHRDTSVITDTLFTEFDISTMESEPVWKKINKKGSKAAFAQLIRNPGDMSKSEAMFIFSETGSTDIPEKEVLTVELSVKPWINLVWLGSFLIAAGFFIAVFRYKN